MFSRESLSFEPVPLPDRMDQTDDEMIKQANAFYDGAVTLWQ